MDKENHHPRTFCPLSEADLEENQCSISKPPQDFWLAGTKADDLLSSISDPFQ